MQAQLFLFVLACWRSFNDKNVRQVHKHLCVSSGPGAATPNFGETQQSSQGGAGESIMKMGKVQTVKVELRTHTHTHKLPTLYSLYSVL
eukprot:3817413-Amphidinium_carterae.1